MSEYQNIPAVRLAPDCTYYRPNLYATGITAEDRALLVMTDLRRVLAVTIGPEASMDAANNSMIAHGIRLLLVTDEDRSIIGLITATDILGEKPMIFLQNYGGDRQAIAVRDIMTPSAEIEVLPLSAVVRARIGDIVATLKQAGRQHALVIDDMHDSRRQTVCGIYSATQIGKQLGVAIVPSNKAQTFAELERVINA